MADYTAEANNARLTGKIEIRPVPYPSLQIPTLKEGLPMDKVDIIVAWLNEHEGDLSDGYTYYAGRGAELDETLRDMAKELVERLKSIKEG